MPKTELVDLNSKDMQTDWTNLKCGICGGYFVPYEPYVFTLDRMHCHVLCAKPRVKRKKRSASAVQVEMQI